MSPIRTHTLTLHRKLFVSACITILLLCALAYIVFQARFLLEGPTITLTNQPNTIQHERQVTLEGIARNITAITVNGRPIVTSEAGVFKESIVLEAGYTIVRIDARDRYGRMTSLEQTFVYVDPLPSVSLVGY